MSSHAERSVASGAASESPDEREAEERPEARDLVPDRLRDRLLAAPPGQMSVSEGSSWFVRMREYTSARRPSMCCAPFANRQPSHLAAARGLVRAVERVRQDRLRHVDVDPAERVDQLAEPVEVDDDDVVDGEAGERADGRDRQRRAAELVRGVDLPGAVAGDLDPEVARDREIREPVRCRDPCAAAAASPSGARRRGRAPCRRRCRRRGSWPDRRGATRRARRAAASARAREPLVRVLDAVREREVAEDAPDEVSSEQADDGEDDPAAPAAATREARTGRGSRRCARGAAPLERDLPLTRPPRYTPVGLVSHGHSGRYGSPRPWAHPS